jgi:hypothetical protein
MTVSIVTLLPEPDSPTTPSICPAFTFRETPRTACTTPSSVAKSTVRPSIWSSEGKELLL